MRRFATVTALMALASILVTTSAVGQKPGSGGIQPLCVTGCGSNPPWVVWAAPTGATVYTSTPYVEIHFCKNSFALDPTNYQVKLNGVDRTSSFANWTWGDPGGLCGGTPSNNAYVSSSSVTFSVGANTLYAKTCDTQDTPLCGSNSRTIYFGAPIASMASYNRDILDYARCANACFAATYAQGTVPYLSTNTPRNVVLNYNGDQV